MQLMPTREREIDRGAGGFLFVVCLFLCQNCARVWGDMCASFVFVSPLALLELGNFVRLCD